MNRRSLLFVLLALTLAAAPLSAHETGKTTMLFNVTSSATDDPHSVTMALQLANHALEDGMKVVLFFNVRGVTVPTKQLPADLAFRAKPIKELLTAVLAKGADAQVCPHCMKALGIEEADLLSGVSMTSREKLFANIGPDTVVFTY